jgi:small basic protein
MKYVLVRSGNRYGPYSVEEVRQYLAAGNIAADDQLEPESGGTPVRAAELTAAPAGIPTAAPSPSAGASPGGFAPAGPMPSPFAGPSAYPAPVLHATIPPHIPPPPAMDWWLVLILSLVTCTLFGFIWTFFQARWVKKLDPSSRATLYLLLSLLFIPIVIAMIVGGGVLSALTGISGGGGGEEVFGILFMLLSIILGLGASVAIIACFISMSQSLTAVTSTWGAARMDLGGTFLAVVIVGWFLNLLFAVAPVYLQYQFDRVRQFQAQAYQGGMAGPRVY